MAAVYGRACGHSMGHVAACHNYLGLILGHNYLAITAWAFDKGMWLRACCNALVQRGVNAESWIRFFSPVSAYSVTY